MTLAFADFTLDAGARELRRSGKTVHVSPKAFDLLVILASHRPSVVDKDTLRDKLWPGTNVVDANLNNLAAEIRAALGDDAQQPRFVRTAHRVGYAFCAAATEVADDAGAAASGVRVFLVWGERRFVLKAGGQIVGRDPASAIWIDAPGVSRRHARVHVGAADPQGGAADPPAGASSPPVTIEDLDSTNGTFVDGKRIRRTVALADGQSIKIGDAALAVRVWSDAGAATKRIRRR